MAPNNVPTVLVVEDEPLVRRMATAIIGNAGWNVIAASDSDEALNILEDHPEVAVLFTDTELRGEMDGIALSEHVHDARPDIELVVTSVRGSIPRRLLPDEGTFLQKPYGVRDLLRVLREKLC